MVPHGTLERRNAALISRRQFARHRGGLVARGGFGLGLALGARRCPRRAGRSRPRSRRRLALAADGALEARAARGLGTRDRIPGAVALSSTALGDLLPASAGELSASSSCSSESRLDPHRRSATRRAVHGARARAPNIRRRAPRCATRRPSRRAVHERRDGRPQSEDQPRPPPRVARGHRRARRRAGRRDARVGPRGRPRDDRGRAVRDAEVDDKASCIGVLS